MLSRAVRHWAGRPHARAFSTAAVVAEATGRRALLAVPAGLGAAAVASLDDPGYFVYSMGAIPMRLGRDVLAAGTTLIDYKFSLRGLEGDAYAAALHDCHERGAARLVDLCFANGGIYIKLGQHIGMLDHLVPEEYVRAMKAHMLNRCPVSDWSQVRAVVREDLGAEPGALFASFSPTPLASASLAQVHEACTHDGRRVAVKVQHRGLRESISVDMATLSALVTGIKWLAPEFDYVWLVEESRRNLPKELDFRQEASNAERCRSNLEASSSTVRGRVVVPAVVHARTSARVLTMEYADGVVVTDVAGLARLGAPREAVARLVGRTFNEMIFVHGFVHCDPHPANMLVRAAPGGGPGWQLVLLDHGLYRQLPPRLRLEYAGLWRALILADVPGIERHARAMGAGNSVPLFAGILTRRPWSQVAASRGRPERLHYRGTGDERQVIRENAVRYAAEITAILRDMPRPLLLLLKTNDCLRAVDRELGAPTSAFVSTARVCCKVLAQERVAHAPGLRSRLAALADRCAVELRLAALQALTAWDRLRGWAAAGRAGQEAKEEVLALPDLN